MEGISELARFFKERDNKPYLGPQLGKVINPPPEIKVSLGEKIILTKEHLVLSAHILKDYEREFEIEGEAIQLEQELPGKTDEVSISGDISPNNHYHSIEKVNINTEYKSKGKIKFTDTLNTGDQVMLIPTTDEQKYYVIDKVVNI